MKILELTNYSAGGCGVWKRVKKESELLSKKGYEVRVFSSNFTKGSEKIAPYSEKIGKIKIKRFPAAKLGGESFMFWNFEKEAIKYSPDIIIAHCYRHLHTTKALKIAKNINARVFLVTHAPFAREESRSFFSNILVKFYDRVIGKKSINKFDKVISITKWEIPFLLSLSCKKEKIVYIPNGISKEFLSKKKKRREKDVILFMGRISPIKNLEVLIKSMSFVLDEKILLKIIGPAEEDYLKKLKFLIAKLKLNNKIEIVNKFYDTKEQIRLLDESKIYVLPSKSEGMPQTLLEAMAREKIVISSDNLGSLDIIKDGKNGFLFPVGDSEELAKKINFSLRKNMNKLKTEARKYVEHFLWSVIIKKLEELF